MESAAYPNVLALGGNYFAFGFWGVEDRHQQEWQQFREFLGYVSEHRPEMHVFAYVGSPASAAGRTFAWSGPDGEIFVGPYGDYEQWAREVAQLQKEFGPLRGMLIDDLSASLSDDPQIPKSVMTPAELRAVRSAGRGVHDQFELHGIWYFRHVTTHGFRRYDGVLDGILLGYRHFNGQREDTDLTRIIPETQLFSRMLSSNQVSPVSTLYRTAAGSLPAGTRGALTAQVDLTQISDHLQIGLKDDIPYQESFAGLVERRVTLDGVLLDSSWVLADDDGIELIDVPATRIEQLLREGKSTVELRVELEVISPHDNWSYSTTVLVTAPEALPVTWQRDDPDGAFQMATSAELTTRPRALLGLYGGTHSFLDVTPSYVERLTTLVRDSWTTWDLDGLVIWEVAFQHPNSAIFGTYRSLIETLLAQPPTPVVDLRLTASPQEFFSGSPQQVDELFEIPARLAPRLDAVQLWLDAGPFAELVRDGVSQPRETGMLVPITELGHWQLLPDAAGSSGRIWFRARSGGTYGAWLAVDVVTQSPPQPSPADLQLLQSRHQVPHRTLLPLAEIVSFENSASRFDQLQLSRPVASRLHFVVDGRYVESHTLISNEQFRQTHVIADSDGVTESLWVRAGRLGVWGPWQEVVLQITSPAPMLPTQLLPQQIALAQGETRWLEEFLSLPPSTEVVVQLWNAAGDAVDVTRRDVLLAQQQAVTIHRREFGDVGLIGGRNGGRGSIWFRFTAGDRWSAWEPMSVNISGGIGSSVVDQSHSQVRTVLQTNHVFSVAGLIRPWAAYADDLREFDVWLSTDSPFALRRPDGRFLPRGTTLRLSHEVWQELDLQTLDTPAAGQFWMRSIGNAHSSRWMSFSFSVADPAGVSDQQRDNVEDRAVRLDLWGLQRVVSADAGALGHTQLQVDAGNGILQWHGIRLPAGTAIDVRDADLDTVFFVPESGISTQQLWRRAAPESTWCMVTSKARDNTAPVLMTHDATFDPQQAISALHLVDIFDADGDVPQRYELWQDPPISAVGAASNSAAFTIQIGHHFFGPERLLTISPVTANHAWIHGASAGSRDRFWIRAHDGFTWSSWKAFVITWQTTNSPTLAQDLIVTLRIGESADLSDMLRFSDPDGDQPVRSQIAVSWSGAAVPSFTVNGADVAAPGVTVESLLHVEVSAGSQRGQTFAWYRAHDGTAWGSWGRLLVRVLDASLVAELPAASK